MRERILIVALICTLAAAGTHPSGSRPNILARFTAENDATMSSGQYRRKSLGQWQYPDYFNQP